MSAALSARRRALVKGEVPSKKLILIFLRHFVCHDRISILIHEIFYSLLLISSKEKIVEKLWGGIRRF